MAAPLDSAVMADFVAQLPACQFFGGSAPGFVWRFRHHRRRRDRLPVPTTTPSMLVEASSGNPWGRYRSLPTGRRPSEAFRDRARWFEKPAQAHMTMWWIAGGRPFRQEAVDRLEFRRQSRRFPGRLLVRPVRPPRIRPAGWVRSAPFDFDGRRMASLANTPNGDVDGRPGFTTVKPGRGLGHLRRWQVRFGALVAVADPKAGSICAITTSARRGVPYRRLSLDPPMWSDGRLRLMDVGDGPMEIVREANQLWKRSNVFNGKRLPHFAM